MTVRVLLVDDQELVRTGFRAILSAHEGIDVVGEAGDGVAAVAAAAELLPVLQQLAIWGERHTPTPSGGGHMALIHEGCGRKTTRGETCSHCGEALVPEQMSWDKPWHGRRDRLVAAGELRTAR